MAATGWRRRRKDAVLNANYVKARLGQDFRAPFNGQPCMHEVLFDDSFLEGTGVTTLDFAKAMIDEGFHPMTMYFPLVVHGAMLIEPTESESKQTLDVFCDAMLELAATGEIRQRRALHRRADQRTPPAARRDPRGPLAKAEMGAGGRTPAGRGIVRSARRCTGLHLSLWGRSRREAAGEGALVSVR